MFKTSFSKYLTAFTVIILVSFVMLSGIITSILSNHLTQEKENKLERAAGVIARQIEDVGPADLKSFVIMHASMLITPIFNFESGFDILISDVDGIVLMSTIGMQEGENPDVLGDLGKIDISEFSSVKSDAEAEADTEYLSYRGTLSGMLTDHSIVIAHSVVTGGEPRGYVFALTSVAEEDRLVTITRTAVINSSVWVMLAAVIATYFITERIIHPLRMMKGAAKSFAKGDFSTRVTVYGKDEIAELATAFNNMAESLENLEKMRNSFLANISHDLRTPMTTISGFIDGITSGAIPPEKHEYYLGVISAEVHRLSRLVSQILDVSRLESGDRKFNFTDFDVAEVARLILISFEQKIEAKKLEVYFEAESDEMPVSADKDAIYQVLYNLCHNAIKFSREGGKFIINVSYAPNKKVRVSVYDEGQTIAKEDLNMVFDRFYKTDKSRGLDKNGVGLGLYISKTIIDAHAEQIHVESDEVGTKFWFTLKASELAPRNRE